MKTQTIFLVIEQGAGIIHNSFMIEEDAEQYAEQRKNETGFDCFEVQPLELNIPENLYF